MHRLSQLFVRPVPPTNSTQGFLHILREPQTNWFGRYTSNDGIGGHIFGDHRACAYHSAIADLNSGQNCGAMSDPHIVPDDYRLATAPVENIRNQFALFSMMTDSVARLDEWLWNMPGCWRQVIIPADLKWEIRDKLDQANITERVLFPGLDGLSQWLMPHYSPKK